MLVLVDGMVSTQSSRRVLCVIVAQSSLLCEIWIFILHIYLYGRSGYVRSWQRWHDLPGVPSTFQHLGFDEGALYKLPDF